MKETRQARKADLKQRWVGQTWCRDSAAVLHKSERAMAVKRNLCGKEKTRHNRAKSGSEEGNEMQCDAPGGNGEERLCGFGEGGGSAIRSGCPVATGPATMRGARRTGPRGACGGTQRCGSDAWQEPQRCDSVGLAVRLSPTSGRPRMKTGMIGFVVGRVDGRERTDGGRTRNNGLSHLRWEL